MWNQQIKLFLYDSFDCFIVYRHNGKCITTSVTHLFQQLILLQRHKWWFCCHFTTNNSLTHKNKLKIIFVLKWKENIQLEFLHLQFLKNCICVITTLMKKKQRMSLATLGSNFSSPSFFKKLHFCASSMFCVIEIKIVVTELKIHIIHFIHFIITFALKLLFIKSRLLYWYN